MSSKYKKIIIICYFGKLNNYFDLWLVSCKYNLNYTFIIFTNDVTNYNYPPNVQPHFVSFEEIKTLFQKNFNFPISLDTPYKLCDYKTAYGDIFSDYLNGYDYWGYCDLDVIFGNLDKIYDDALLEKYDKIWNAAILPYIKILMI